MSTPAPRLVDVKWREGQRFSPSDDPDRTKVPHEFPSILRTGETFDPSAMKEEILDVSSIKGRGGTNSFAKVVYNVLSKEECMALMETANTKGWTPALINIGGGFQQYMPDYRLNHRCVMDDEELAQLMFQRLIPYLPETMRERKLACLNERMRLLCYHQPNQRFEAHYDGEYTRDPIHPRGRETSFVTVQIYLNEDFEGGATTFLGRSITIPFQPKQGSVLIFSQDLLHEGSPVLSGIKYTMRTEAMYAPK